MKGECSLQGCGQPVKSKGLCKRHYQQQWATGSPEIRRPNPHGTPEERFWRHVSRGADDECWTWNAFKDNEGYGKFRLGKSNTGAHRFSYELHFGPIPEGLLVRHKCNNPPCVNPAHLCPGDHDANMRDRVEAGNYATGERHPMARITRDVVAAIRLSSDTNRQLAARFRISESQVGNIRRGDQWKALEAEESPNAA